MNELTTLLRMSWDSDVSIMSQTSEWMSQRRKAADRIEALTAENAALRADECDPDGCAAHISAFASQVDALTAQLAQRDAALKAALEVLQDMHDHGGEDWVVERAFAFLAAYRRARGQDETAKG